MRSKVIKILKSVLLSHDARTMSLPGCWASPHGMNAFGVGMPLCSWFLVVV
jgi:hypothetical protein